MYHRFHALKQDYNQMDIPIINVQEVEKAYKNFCKRHRVPYNEFHLKHKDEEAL